MSDSLFASASVRPRLERRERRAETDRSGDAVQHDVGLDIAHQLLGLVGAERRVLDAELARPARRRAARFGAGGEPDDLEAPRVRADHLERLGADRAGGAEDEDAAHAVSLAIHATTLDPAEAGRRFA